VTQIMKGWPSPFWSAQSGSECQAGKDSLESISGVPPLSRVDEEGRLFAVGERSVTHSSILTQEVQRRTMEWNESAFSKLALSDKQHSGFQVHISTVETNDFTDA